MSTTLHENNINNNKVLSTPSPVRRSRENVQILVSTASPGKEAAETISHLLCDKENLSYNDANKLDIMEPPKLKRMRINHENNTIRSKPRKPAYSRKEKSLSVLCEKLYMREDEKAVIKLNDVATSLNVERRRIYDIINVLQCVSLVSRDSKNKYIWSGTNEMIDSINYLKIEALNKVYPSNTSSTIPIPFNDSSSSNNSYNNSIITDSNYQNADSRRSLSSLSKEFIMMFLRGERELYFDNISRELIGDVNNVVLKTKVRRLYDIANVLSSIGIICKNGSRCNASRTFYRWTSHVLVYDKDGNYSHKYVGPYPQSETMECDLVKPILPNQPVSLICDEMKDLSQGSYSSELSNQSFSDEDITEDKLK